MRKVIAVGSGIVIWAAASAAITSYTFPRAMNTWADKMLDLVLVSMLPPLPGWVTYRLIMRRPRENRQ